MKQLPADSNETLNQFRSLLNRHKPSTARAKLEQAVAKHHASQVHPIVARNIHAMSGMSDALNAVAGKLKL